MTERAGLPTWFPSRMVFTLGVFPAVGFWPSLLIVLSPYLSPNQTIQAWSLSDSLWICLSVLSGPFAFASNTTPSWVFAGVLAVSFFAYAVRPAGFTAAVTILGVALWVGTGLMLTFVDV